MHSADAHPPAHDAAATWAAERDLLLRGLNHALSNRVGTLAAVAGVLEPGDTVRPHVAQVLHDETARLERLLTLYRLLPEEPEGSTEPLHVPDVMPAILELHAEHPDLRDVPCTVEAVGVNVPARAAPGALNHALLLALSAAKRAAGADGRVRLAIGAGEGMVRVRAHPEPAREEPDPIDRAVEAALHADAAARLLAAAGGSAHACRDGGVELRLRAWGARE